MYVKAKYSGELLNAEGDGDLWTPGGVIGSAEKLARAYRQREKLQIAGFTAISGAGNIIRGNKLREHGIAQGYEDVLGRLATIQNTLVISARLKQRSIPHEIFVAGTMGLVDGTLGTLEPHDMEAEKQAHDNERLVLIAGGSGEDNKTTDNAVLHYANVHKSAYPDDKVTVLKGTKHDGIFSGDPEILKGDAVRYSEISAGYMLQAGLGGVETACLETIQATGLSMRAYKDAEHDLEAALAMNGSGIGTLIVPGYSEPVPA